MYITLMIEMRFVFSVNADVGKDKMFIRKIKRLIIGVGCVLLLNLNILAWCLESSDPSNLALEWEKLPLSIKGAIYHLHYALKIKRIMLIEEKGGIYLSVYTRIEQIMKDRPKQFNEFEDFIYWYSVLTLKKLSSNQLLSLKQRFSLYVPEESLSPLAPQDENDSPGVLNPSSHLRQSFISHLENAANWAPNDIRVPLRNVAKEIRKLNEEEILNYIIDIKGSVVLYSDKFYSLLGFFSYSGDTLWIVSLYGDEGLALSEIGSKFPFPSLPVLLVRANVKDGNFRYIKDIDKESGDCIFINPKLEIVRNRMGGVINVKVIYPQTVIEAIKWELEEIK